MLVEKILINKIRLIFCLCILYKNNNINSVMGFMA